MKYKVAIYCPDQHLLYDLHTLDEKGVGGGVTARIRTAHALAAAGHEVTAYVNCPKDETIEGVHYVHYSRVEKIQTDIFIASTSGGDLDLSSLREKDVAARLRILMLHGKKLPNGTDPKSFDHVYALSNFILDLATKNWGREIFRFFVSHRGIAGDLYGSRDPGMRQRDLFAMVYAGHPSKGLDTAIEILRIVREHDPRFSLHIYGGYRLWGEDEQSIPNEPGVFYHGMLGQKDLAQRMQECGYSLILQDLEEGFGMVVIESMRAGCIVLASAVGAYPELIRNGHNGFLVAGDHREKITRLDASQLILDLMSRPQYTAYIRRNAAAYPLDWSVIAQAWEGHWDWALSGKQPPPDQFGLGSCPSCGGSWLTLSDGFHCTGCGRYARDLTP